MKKKYNSPKTNVSKLRIKTSIQDTSIHDGYGDDQFAKKIQAPEPQEDTKWGDMW